jgi:hypothetical protein
MPAGQSWQDASVTSQRPPGQKGGFGTTHPPSSMLTPVPASVAGEVPVGAAPDPPPHPHSEATTSHGTAIGGGMAWRRYIPGVHGYTLEIVAPRQAWRAKPLGVVDPGSLSITAGRPVRRGPSASRSGTSRRSMTGANAWTVYSRFFRAFKAIASTTRSNTTEGRRSWFSLPYRSAALEGACTHHTDGRK